MINARRPISFSDSPIKIKLESKSKSKSKSTEEEEEEEEKLVKELLEDYEDSEVSKDSNESSNEYIRKPHENGSNICPEQIDFYSNEYKKNSPVILLIRKLEPKKEVASEVNIRKVAFKEKSPDKQDDKQDDKQHDKQHDKPPNKQYVKQHKRKSDSYSDTPDKSGKKEKLDMSTIYINIILIIHYVNVKYNCIRVLYHEIHKIYMFFATIESLKNYYTKMEYYDNSSNNIYYNINTLDLLKNLNNIKKIKEELDKIYINPTSIKIILRYQHIEILKFLTSISHMAGLKNENNFLNAEIVQLYEDRFNNKNKKYKKFSKKIITKFEQKNSPEKGISQNPTNCFPFCMENKEDDLKRNNLTYENIIRKYILIDIGLFKNIIENVYDQIHMIHGRYVSFNKFNSNTNYNDFFHIKNIPQKIDNIIKNYENELLINYKKKYIPILSDQKLVKTKTKCSKILTPLQVGPSCWFMATIVAMFYSQRSRKILLKQIDKESTKKKVDDELYNIFNDILNDKENSNNYNEDETNNTFWRIMTLLYNKNKEIFPYKPSINKGYNSDFYIGRLYNLLDIDYTIIEYNNENNYMVYSLLNEEYNDDYTITQEIKKQKEQPIYQIVKKTIKKAVSYFIPTKDKYKKLIKKTPNILIVIVKDKNIYGARISTFNKEIQKIETDETNYNQIKSMEDTIQYNGNDYNLDSVILGNYYSDTTTNPIHNIAGITCKKNKYIYNGWPRTNKIDVVEKKYQHIPCELIKSNWNIKNSFDFCIDPKTRCMDKKENIQKYPEKFILNLENTAPQDVPTKLCFNFGKGNRTLIYVKKHATSSASTSGESSSSPAQQQKSILKKPQATQRKVPQSPPGPAQPAPVSDKAERNFNYIFSRKPDQKGNPDYPNTSIYNSIGKDYIKKDNIKANFMASLNAGDPSLYVGGNTINGQFGEDIFNSLQNSSTVNSVNSLNDLRNISTKLHIDCYESCKQKNKYILNNLFHYSELDKTNPYCKEMYLYISQETLVYAKSRSMMYYPGDVFIEILKENPRQNKDNKAMIYCVGPNGDPMTEILISNKILNNIDQYQDRNQYYKRIEEIFLLYVNYVGKNIATAINLYNNTKGEKHEKIDYVRICLISGFAFLPNHMKPSDEVLKDGKIIKDNSKIRKLSRKKVAEQIITGIHSINKKVITINNIVYEFAWADNAFIDAFEDIKKINTKTHLFADFKDYVIN